MKNKKKFFGTIFLLGSLFLIFACSKKEEETSSIPDYSNIEWTESKEFKPEPGEYLFQQIEKYDDEIDIVNYKMIVDGTENDSKLVLMFEKEIEVLFNSDKAEYNSQKKYVKHRFENEAGVSYKFFDSSKNIEVYFTNEYYDDEDENYQYKSFTDNVMKNYKVYKSPEGVFKLIMGKRESYVFKK